jgi:tetratricopeptide (TPR) repeat protein
MGRHAEADARLCGVLAALRKVGSKQLIAYAAQDLALTRFVAGDLERARASFDEALAAFRAVSNSRGVAATTLNLAELAFMAGDPTAAIGIASAVATGPESGVHPAHLAANMAGYYIALERWDEALRWTRQAIDVIDGPRDVMLPASVEHAAAIAAHLDPANEAARVARLIGFSDARLALLQMQRGPNEQRRMGAMMARLAAMLANDGIARYAAEGRQWDFEHGLFEVHRMLERVEAAAHGPRQETRHA